MLIRLLIIISIITSTARLFAATSYDSLLAFADRQFAAGNYELAVKEYLRIGIVQKFSDPDIQFRLANSYYMTGDWATARAYYDQVSRLTMNDSLLVSAKISKISSLVSEGKYKQALVDLYSIPDTVYQKYHIDIDILFAICFFGLGEFEKSKVYFQHAVKGNPEAQAEIESIFNKKKSFYKPYTALATTLSILLPGLGQMYAGEWTQGLNSFILTESLLLLGLIVSFEYSILDAVFSVLPWYQRYYLGGMNNAGELAVLQRQKRRSKAFKNVMDIVKEVSENE